MIPCVAMDAYSTDISVVLPVFNEGESLCPLYDELIAALVPLDRPFELIFCDDGSTDNSLAALKQLAAKDPRVKVIVFARNLGRLQPLTPDSRPHLEILSFPWTPICKTSQRIFPVNSQA